MKTNKLIVSNQSFSLPMAMAGIVIAVVLWQIVGLVIWNPLRNRLDQIATTNQKLTRVQAVVARGERAEGYCSRLSKESLSADPVVVAHRYQQWLLKRTERIGEITVTPSAAILEPSLGWRVPMQVEGTCKLKELAALVDELTKMPLLHRIAYLNMEHDQNAKKKAETVQFSMTLEALAMKFSETLAAMPQPTNTGDGAILEAFLMNRQPFTRGYQGPRPPPIVAKDNSEKKTISKISETPPIDPLSTLKLVGSVEISGTPQAWLSDSRTRQEFFVSKSQPFVFDSVRGTITNISSDSIEVEVDGKSVHWEMGRSLRTSLDAK